MAELRRLFLAIALPDDVRDLLASVLSDRLGDSIERGLVPPRNWHLTLRFLGPTDEVTSDRLLAGVDGADLGRAFRLDLSGIGTFPNARRATVLWVGVSAGAGRLTELAETIEGVARNLGFEPEERPFRPHMTVARLRPAVDLRSVVDAVDIPPIGFDCRSVALFESSLGGGPARYRIVEEFALAE